MKYLSYYDEYSHWQPCIVSGCPNPNEGYEGNVFHWGGGATCHTSGICSECGAEYYTEHDFGSGYYVYVDEMTCARKCAFEGCNETADWSYHEGGVATCQQKSVCDICHTEYGEFAECMGGTATCTEKAVCATCGEEYGDFVAHNYDIVNGYKEADGHANTCSCGAHETPIAHNPDRLEATETEPIKCTVCGYIITPATGHINHTPKAEWKNDANNHWHECTGCEGQQLEKAAHTDSDTNGKCDVCDADVPVLPPVHTHDYGTIWETDTNNHWKECECGEKSENAAHNDGDADGKCDVCDYDMPTTPGGETSEQPENPEQPEQPENPETPEETKGLSGGAIAGIVVGSVAVVGIGGFALVWFVIKKKTWAELIAIFKKK